MQRGGGGRGSEHHLRNTGTDPREAIEGLGSKGSNWVFEGGSSASVKYVDD